MKRLIAIFCITMLLLSNTAVARAPEAPASPQITNVIYDNMVKTTEKCIVKFSRPIVILEEPINSTTTNTTEREIEYPNAEFIWNYLQELGFNNYVCAGIIGNMMVESGGHTLAIEEDASTNSYYGICQWSRKYYPDVIGVSLDAQCDYLRDTIQYELDTFGSCYRRGFNYEDFLDLNNEQDAALAFAKCYERCSSDGYGLRQECATTAYNYFTNLE